ncbi:MAG TPA: tRNA (adenosine(37)-N6)-threonylcarbamoyltransferase complex dimerization subunit type 1 TsaB [Candidatus Dormibacteraeota bacterium]|nr:tRNA (adenosine(37)-N6)-threonylcarbamoyltransferase complex dimerization subunit type 1 TsaB [Candidatus Dormibacteraeota bacterium]
MRLAIDTSGTDQALSLVDASRAVARVDWVRSREDPPVLTRLQALMREGGARPDDLEAVAADRGPGSFTGLRIGLSLAAGISYARHLPLYLLDSLPILAMRSRPEPVTVALRDAGHGEVYAWRQGEEITRMSVSELSSWLPATGRIMVEPAGRLAAWSPVHGSLEVSPPERAPASEALAAFAIESFKSAKPVRYDEVQALYVQPAGAEERKRKTPS